MRSFTIFAIALLLLSSCSKESSSSAPGGATQVKLQLNWKPEPEFGGFYAAQLNGAYAKHGLDVDIVVGGVGTPTVQMIATGQVTFGILSADQLIINRSQGGDVVAIFAVYQTNPQGLMTHAARGLTTIADVFARDGTVAIEKGLSYASFLENKYGFDKVHIVPSPGGDLTAFRGDPNFTMQCFVTSEPLAAKKAGLDPQTFLIAESGYNPYTTVVATTQTYLKAHPKEVKAMIAAVREGWQAYLADPTKTNETMQKLNPSMDAETFKASADAQKALIHGELADGSDIGAMSLERWLTLIKQLGDLKAINKPVVADECFVEESKLK